MPPTADHYAYIRKSRVEASRLEAVNLRLCVEGMLPSVAPGGWLGWRALPEASSPAPGAIASASSTSAIIEFKDRPTQPICYFGPTPEAIDCIASRPEIVAWICGASIDEAAMYEDLVLGYRLGRRTLFSSVKRLLWGERAEISDSNSRLLQSGELVTSSCEDLVASLVDIVGAAMRSGATLELTGGLDSRLILALALAGGTKPRVALTLGGEESPDVQVARRLCKRYSIEHVVLEAQFTQDTDIHAAEQFVRESGFHSSAASYGWLPEVFRRLKGIRDAQITGTGGECAGGFYYSPGQIDTLVEWLGIEQQWTHRRIRVPGTIGHRLLHRHRRTCASRKMLQDIREALRSSPPFRRRLDNLYTEHRVRQWAIPVLAASTSWYRCEAPFLSDAYLAWALQVPLSERVGRVGQHNFLRTLSPELAEEPYAGAIDQPRTQNRRVVVARKIARRLIGRRQVPDQGASHTAKFLAQDPDTRSAIEHFVSDHPQLLDEQKVNVLIDRAELFASELGFLVTASWAYREASRWSD